MMNDGNAPFPGAQDEAKKANSSLRKPSSKTRSLADALLLALKQVLNFHPAACAVAVVLARFAFSAPTTKIKIDDLAEASDLSHRSVQRALRELENAGFIEIEYQKIRRAFNEPNLYRLSKIFQTCFETAREVGAEKRGDSSVKNDSPDTEYIKTKNQESKIYKSTSYNEQPTKNVGHASKRKQPKVAEQATASELSANLWPDAPSDWEALASRAVHALDPEALDGNPWAALDRLRRERLPGFHSKFWQISASKHAHRALLAVAEVLL